MLDNLDFKTHLSINSVDVLGDGVTNIPTWLILEAKSFSLFLSNFDSFDDLPFMLIILLEAVYYLE